MGINICSLFINVSSVLCFMKLSEKKLLVRDWKGTSMAMNVLSEEYFCGVHEM
jgi:hypothetical protein